MYKNFLKTIKKKLEKKRYGKKKKKKKGTNLFSKTISSSLNVIWNASTDTKDNDNTSHNLNKSHDIDQALRDLSSTNPSNLNICYLNIISVRNKFTDFQEMEKWMFHP